jgi:hypothetical protein
MKRTLLPCWFPIFILVAASSCSRSQSLEVEKASRDGQPVSAPSVKVADRVEVFYFHGERRCPTCLGIQSTIEETLRERLAAEMASGKLVYREVNFELPENKHFVEEFQLSFSTMVIARVQAEKTVEWENCQKVWDYAHQKDVLAGYVAERINSYLARLGANK